VKRRIAILTPWYGQECTGGAEMLARELAQRLSERDAVTVLTTTSRSFLHEWDKDYHKPGRFRDGNYDVVRFRVRRRNSEAFAANNEQLLGLPRHRWPEISRYGIRTDFFLDESINSPELEAHVKRQGGAWYDAILALPYLYGVVVNAIKTAQAPIHLIPCLHDEAYARIPRIEDAMHRAKTLLFNSAGEAELALRLYGPGILEKSYVIGTGIPPAYEPALTSPIEGRYYLYLGRREPEKGVDLLVGAFRHHRYNGSRREVKLVLAGPGERSYDDAEGGIRDLGFIDEATKARLLKDALALLQPSQNESYSRVLMEAWRENVPVVAHAECLATATAVLESKGGLLAATGDEWAAALRALEEMEPAERRRIGALGAQYAAEHSDWDKAISRLRAAIGLDEEVAGTKPNGKRIDQILEAFDRGDAISDHARGIASRLRALGYQSKIYAAHIAPGVDDASPLPQSLSFADGLIYHHSIGSDVAECFVGARGRKSVIYHNVTPAHFFDPYAPKVAQQLRRGRDQLERVVAASDICIGDSEFNADEMRALGGRNVQTIPVATQFRRFDVSPSACVVRAKRGTTWLFVGRVSPNKGLSALIDAFEAFLRLDEDAALVILGKFDRSDRYYSELKGDLVRRGTDPYVTLTGYVDEAGIVGYYRNADVFVCLSEHEGFCVPLIEAMFFDVPVVAKAATAIPFTLGKAGLLLEPNADAYDVAAAAYEVCMDARLREQIIAAQRDRRRDFLPSQVDPLINKLAADLVPT